MVVVAQLLVRLSGVKREPLLVSDETGVRGIPQLLVGCLWVVNGQALLGGLQLLLRRQGLLSGLCVLVADHARHTLIDDEAVVRHLFLLLFVDLSNGVVALALSTLEYDVDRHEILLFLVVRDVRQRDSGLFQVLEYLDRDVVAVQALGLKVDLLVWSHLSHKIVNLLQVRHNCSGQRERAAERS